MEGTSKVVNTEDLKIFMYSKMAEIEFIIFKHIEEQPREIARAIVEELDYHRIPLSLTVRRRPNETT
jgi:hypothetical protein